MFSIKFIAALFSVFLFQFVSSDERGCRSLIDFCIVVDGSDSISSTDFTTLRKSVSSLVERLNIDQGEGRMGIVVYSSDIALKVPLTFDKKYLQTKAMNMPHPRDGTNTALGIETMKMMFRTDRRDGVPMVGIVVTDGISKQPIDTIKQANLSKDLGVDMFSVGVTNLIDIDELEAIASTSRQVLTVDSFDALARNIENLVLMVCPTTQTPPVTTTMKPAPTPPVTMAPTAGPCDNCKMQNGVGFNPHPDDCDKFTQCYFGFNKQILAVYRQCPFGQYWDQNVMTCRPSEEVVCDKEKCLHPGLLSYPYGVTTSCRAYWKCNLGKATGMCCPEGYAYQPYKGCTRSKTCNDTCPPQLTHEGACDTRPSWKNPNGYEQFVHGFGWIPMPCAPGTAYDSNTCMCSFHSALLPGKVCKPEVDITFTKDCNDESGKAVYVENVNVTLTEDGLGYFDGISSKLVIPRFANMDHYTDMVIKMSYLDMPEKQKKLRGMLSNGDCCSSQASMMLVKSNSNLHYMARCKTGQTTSFHLPMMPGNWNEALYIHDTKKLEGKVNGITTEQWAYGPIKTSQAGLQIGYVKGLPNFHGYMDYVTIYMCRPLRL